MEFLKYFYAHPLKPLDSLNPGSDCNQLTNPCLPLSQKLPSPTKEDCVKADSNPGLKPESTDSDSLLSLKREKVELSIDNKVDAIIESTRKKHKELKPAKKPLRNRKTTDQLKTLNEEFKNMKEVSNTVMCEIGKIGRAHV